jgi:hypothetical protein
MSNWNDLDIPTRTRDQEDRTTADHHVNLESSISETDNRKCLPAEGSYNNLYGR